MTGRSAWLAAKRPAQFSFSSNHSQPSSKIGKVQLAPIVSGAQIKNSANIEKRLKTYPAARGDTDLSETTSPLRGKPSPSDASVAARKDLRNTLRKVGLLKTSTNSQSSRPVRRRCRVNESHFSR